MYRLNHCFCLRPVPCFCLWHLGIFMDYYMECGCNFSLGEERENILMSKQKVIERRLHGDLFTHKKYPISPLGKNGKVMWGNYSVL